MKPLSERLRPKSLDEILSQEHLIGKQGIIRKMINNDSLSSMILWGPPGVGKTTLAEIIAKETNRRFFKLNAIESGVKQIREIIEKNKKNALFNLKTPILFIDEIHRFNKTQQNSLLEAIEKGDFILIGATTENPSYEIIPPLLSRCQVFILNRITEADLRKLLKKAIETDEILKQKKIFLKEDDKIISYAGGDARKLLNILELIVNSQTSEIIEITNALTEKILQNTPLKYDKKGDYHYDLISAFIKSIRGSDPNAAVYYLARLLESGEDIKFIARRLIISAAEDIGLANPNALILATETFKAVETIGMPEARIILSHTTIYLATSPKSNSAYLAINEAIEQVKKSGDLPIPLHLRNATNDFTKNLNYGKDYLYPHDFQNNFVQQTYLPEKIKDLKFYNPQNNAVENNILKRLKKWWKDKY